MLSILTIIFGFSQCGSLKFKDNPPFIITSATYVDWVGGQPGIKGTNVKINYTSDTDIKFENVYFQNRITKLQTKKAISGKLVIGYFSTSTRQNEIVLDANPVKELNNPIPETQKFPFDLKENEAVISYRIKGKIKFHKIKSLNKEKFISFPSPAKQ